MTINEYLAAEHAKYTERMGSDVGQFRFADRIKCADGLTLSVQASEYHYCIPRLSVGPWSHVEVGYPSERVGELMPYVEDENYPCDTVYGAVPVDVVDAVIAEHGGMV